MKPDLDYLRLALQYKDKTQWESDENIWLLRLRDYTLDKFHQWQGVFLSHHYWKWEVHLHCTRLKDVGGKSDFTMRVFYLYNDKPDGTLAWLVCPTLALDYQPWLEVNAEVLENLNKLLKGYKT